jgi:hypothetical protein
MNNLKRFTVCKVMNHKWAKTSYPPSPDGGVVGTYLRCRRCGKENHEGGSDYARGSIGGHSL